MRVSVNGLPVAEASWAGRTERIVEAELPAGLLHVGENTLTLENVADTGAAYSMVFLNLFRVAYPRSVADGVAEPGRLAGLADEGGTVTAAGFESGAFVLDTTAPAPLWVRGAATGPAGAAFRVEPGRSYRVVAPSAVRRPEVRRAGPPHLLASSNRADWLLVGPRELLPAAAPLVELRRSQGLRVKAVALEDVYAQFGHGEADPQALRLFLAHAYATWKRPSPRYVLLLGDSTYDPKDHLKTGVRDHLPSALVRTSHLWTASDPSLAAVNGDDLVPDLALGRLPAKNEEEARRLIEKVVAFEQGGHDLQGTGSSWPTTPTPAARSRPTPKPWRKGLSRAATCSACSCASWAAPPATRSGPPSTRVRLSSATWATGARRCGRRRTCGTCWTWPA